MKHIGGLLLGMALWLCLGGGGAQAQFVTISGTVRDAADEAPMPAVNLVLTQTDDGQRRGLATDDDGRFTFPRLLPGPYILEASFVGYLSHTDTLTVDFGEQLRLTIRLRPDRQALQELVVETERVSDQAFTGVAHTTIRPAALARVPMPDVTADLAAYLLTMPGFVSSGDRGGQLFVRGGTPTQNLVMLDGMPIYQPFHIVGFYSAFPADIISYADVYAGGFGARFGGRLSSVIDIHTRNGNKERVVGAASVAPFLSSIRLEVPLKPGEVSLVASARESIIERIAPNVLGQDLPFRFGDQFLKFHAFLNQTSSFSATALRTYDEGTITALDEDPRRSTWRNQAYGGRYLYLPPEYPVMFEVTVYVSSLHSSYRLTAEQERLASIEGGSGQMHFTYLLGPTQIDFGIYGGTTFFDYDLGGRQGAETESMTSGGAFLDTRFELLPGLRIEPGVRFQAFSRSVGTTIEPRLRLFYQPGGATGRHAFSLAGGQYHQQIVGLTDEQDVTTAFTAWAATPRRSEAPRALHLIAGWEARLGAGLTASLEGYFKDFENLAYPRFSTALNELSRFELVGGAAKGVDVRLEWTRPRLYAYAGYSLATVTYQSRGVQIFTRIPNPNADAPNVALFTEPFHPPHDRRHQLNLLSQVTQGPYRLNVRWQFGSGLPFTQINGYYNGYRVPNPNDRAFHTATGTTFASRAKPFSSRLPTYHRLDVSAERVFDYDRVAARVQLGVINLYDRANIFDFNFFSGKRVNQLPLIPSLGLRVDMK